VSGSIHVDRWLDAPPAPLFEVLADHAGFVRFSGVRRAEVIVPGEPPPNGLGAVRRIWAGPFRFDEEITAWEPPHSYSYLIRELRGFRIHHRGGTIRLTEEGSGTRAVWTSDFDVPIPLLGAPLARIFAASFARAFEDVLDRAAQLTKA
jgi:uncharacterized protein YndB with AHSA1/START domain